MNHTRALWICGTVVALGGIALVHGVSSEPEKRDSDPASVVDGRSDPHVGAPETSLADMARMNAQVAMLRAQVSGLEDEVSAGQPLADGRPAPEDAMSEEERRAEDERRQDDYMTGVEAAFEREPVDAKWSSSTNSRVWNAINQMEAMRGAARAVECRSQSCRIEVGDDGSGALHKNLPLFAQEFADSMPRMAGRAIRDENGGTRMILYLMGPEQDQLPTPKN